MRVIAGEFKGRGLIAPKGLAVRPTTARVKEAIFSMIQPVLQGAVCLDLFAGSGALGIEALSRGASHVYFCDASAESATAIKRNLDVLGVDASRVTLFLAAWRGAVSMLSEKCNLVFIDAPYEMCDYYPQMLEALAQKGVLHAQAWIVIERDAGSSGYALPERFELLREKRYGGIGVDLIRYGMAGEGK